MKLKLKPFYLSLHFSPKIHSFFSDVLYSQSFKSYGVLLDPIIKHIVLSQRDKWSIGETSSAIARLNWDYFKNITISLDEHIPDDLFFQSNYEEIMVGTYEVAVEDYTEATPEWSAFKTFLNYLRLQPIDNNPLIWICGHPDIEPLPIRTVFAWEFCKELRENLFHVGTILPLKLLAFIGEKLLYPWVYFHRR